MLLVNRLIALDGNDLIEMEGILLDGDAGAALEFLKRLHRRLELEARKGMKTPLEHPGDRL